MYEAIVNGIFVSEKISKIRWIPELYSSPNLFLTGSWGFDQNSIRLWNLDDYKKSNGEIEFSPKCEAKLSVSGDVAGLEIIGPENFVFITSEGSAAVIKISKDSDNNNIKVAQEFEKLHKFDSNDAAPCTALSTHDNHFATVGEDGRINILSCNKMKILRTFNNADSISLTAVSFINYNEILTGNRMGTIKMFDSRSNTDHPQTVFLISCQDKNSNSVNVITYHPTQKHIILGGSEEGSITVWDLRKPNLFASYFTAHNSGITELSFHQTQPNKVFSASENGEIWQWCYNTAQIPAYGIDGQKKIEEIDPWLNGERAKNKFNVTSLMNGVNKSINSYDTFDNRVIVGCDNEAIYFIENMS